MYLSLSNRLVSGDYILLQFGQDTYYNSTSSVSCPQATCSISSQSTSNVLVVRVEPSVNQLSTPTITLQISGLTSSSSTIYNEVAYFNVSSLSAAGRLIDQGAGRYNVSCGAYPLNNCKECYSNGNCFSCYTQEGMNLLNGRCVSNCTLETQYFSYSASGTCKSCSNNCNTCFN